MKTRKKYGAGLICFLLALNPLLAQQNRFIIGITGGPSFSNFHGMKQKVIDYKDGKYFAAGVSFQYNLPKILSLTSGCLYERKGGVGQIPFTNSQGALIAMGTQELRYDYAVIPIMVRATFGKKVNLFVNAGGYAAFLNSSQQRFSATMLPSFIQTTTDAFKRYDLGTSAGTGVGVPIAKIFLISLEARYNLGLVNIISHPSSGVEPLKVRSLNVLLSFCYQLGKR